MFTCFSSKEEKTQFFAEAQDMITGAFAQVAVAVLYRLDALTARSSIRLRVTSAILAGIFDGSIVYWNDTVIQRANTENIALLPYQKIKVDQMACICAYHA